MIIQLRAAIFERIRNAQIKAVQTVSISLVSDVFMSGAQSGDWHTVIRAVMGQRSSPESGFANKTKMFFRAKKKRR